MFAFLIYILCYDIWYYFAHRLLHTKHLYWIHKIHHKNYQPQYYDFYTIHILEIPIQSIGLLIGIYLYKLYINQFICSIIMINMRGLLTHDKRFIYIVGDHHLNHHKYIFYNYGEYWLDYIFDTLHSDQKKIA